jgi:chromosome segregation ATPase
MAPAKKIGTTSSRILPTQKSVQESSRIGEYNFVDQSGSKRPRITSADTSLNSQSENNMDLSDDKQVTQPEEIDNTSKMLSAIESLKQSLETKIDKSTSSIKTSIENIQVTVTQHQNDIESLKLQINNFAAGGDVLSSKVAQLEHSQEVIEREMKKINLIISGVADCSNEFNTSLRGKIETLLQDITSDIIKVDAVARIGSYQGDKSRQVKVRFLTIRDRDNVWNCRTNTNPPIFINEDLPFSIRRDHAVIRKKVKQLKEDNIQYDIKWGARQIQTEQHLYTIKEGRTTCSATQNNSSSNFLGSGPSAMGRK